jgi:hypothetical protein
LCAWLSSVGNGNGQIPNVIGNDPICHVNVICIIVTDSTLVRDFTSRDLLDGGEDGGENIGVVVGAFVL